MGEISSFILVILAFVLVAIVAARVRRKWGSRSLLWVWIASAFIITGTILFWIFYQLGFPLPSTRQEFFAIVIDIASVLMATAVTSGIAVCFSAIFGPPTQASSSEINYFPFNLPMGKLEDTYGLTGILRKYQELLSTFLIALDSALGLTPFNPYLRQPRAFLRGFRSYLPSFVRQARVSSHQFDRAPNALMRDLAGADGVLAELETLTPAQLSAIEECHRVNTRRLRQRSILRRDWWGKIAVVCTAAVPAISYLAIVVEKVAGKKPDDLWPVISGITFTMADLQLRIILGVISILVILVLFLMSIAISIMTFLPALRRVQAFEDILTIAKAYRKGASEAIKPPAELSLTVTD
jgi:hypothetical protein